MKKKDEIKVCLVGSSGGHLTHLYMLKPFWKDKNRFWVTFDKEDIEEIKRKSEQDEVIPFKDSFNIVTVGRLTEQKGYDIAIKAASILKKRKINFVWYAIGGGRDEEKLKKLVEKCCLENQFVFLGRKRNPYPYMEKNRRI